MESAISQTYSNIEIIVVDDGSSDGSKEVIRDFLIDKKEIQFLDLQKNIGNCKAFNQAFRKSKGEFIIDLSTDDVLLPDRVQKQVGKFLSLDDTYGVVYSDASVVDKKNKELFQQSHLFPVFEGDVYQALVSTYFISPPTMMIKRKVLDFLDGYDETLAYEDFDFWVRSSRYFKYAHINEVLTRVRRLPNSKSVDYNDRKEQMINSTIKVCHKVKEMNQNEKEDVALLSRLKYELKHCAIRGLKSPTDRLFQLIEEPDQTDKMWRKLGSFGVSFEVLLRGYQNLKR